MSFKPFIIPSLSLLIFTCSCKQSSPAYTALNEELITSSDKLRNKNDSLYGVLGKLLLNPKATDHTKLWYFKAIYFQNASQEVYGLIQSAITHIKSDSVSYNGWDSLYKKLIDYKDQILRIDPEMYDTIHDNAIKISHNLDSLSIHHRDIGTYLFKRPKDEQIFNLNEILNRIVTLENQMLAFCDKKGKRLE